MTKYLLPGFIVASFQLHLGEGIEAMDLLRKGVFVALCLGVGCNGLAMGADGNAPPWAVPTRHADVFRCDSHACTLPRTGTYPDLIIGRFKAMATPAQSRRLFSDMRSHHAWKALPDNPDAFHAVLQPVAIDLPGGASMVVLMTQAEVRAAKPKPGDLVRYAPHRGSYEIPPTDPKARAYWSVDGCVAVVCRAGDKGCFHRYPSGIYRTRDGVALSPRTRKPLPNRTAINPESLLPVQDHAATQGDLSH